MSNNKFRYWDKSKKEMVYVEGIFNKKPRTETSSFAQYESCPSYHDVEIMQFTGLQDSKGNEVYEGDILDFDPREWGGKFDNEIVPSMEELIGDWPLSGLPNDVKEWRTVVGNIHQPDLAL